MSVILPSSSDVGNLMALIAVVSDAKKSSAVLEAIKAETDAANKARDASVSALAEVQQAQRVIGDTKIEAAKLKADAEKSMADSVKREQELDAVEKAVTAKLDAAAAADKLAKADRAALEKAVKELDAAREAHAKAVAALEADRALLVAQRAELAAKMDKLKALAG